MSSHELTPDTILVSVDGINSAPWRLGEGSGRRAFTAEQEAELAARFDLKPEALRNLSGDLGLRLNSDGVLASVSVDASILASKGEAKVQKALEAVGKSQKQLTDQLDELKRLSVGRWASQKAKAAFHQACVSINDALTSLQQANDDLQRTLDRPGTVRLDTVPDKRRVRDERRVSVLDSIFREWQDAGRPMTYSTDIDTSERRGPLIDFVNAVVRCVTEPATELPGETIVKDLREYLRSYNNDLAYGEWYCDQALLSTYGPEALE